MVSHAARVGAMTMMRPLRMGGVAVGVGIGREVVVAGGVHGWKVD